VHHKVNATEELLISLSKHVCLTMAYLQSRENRQGATGHAFSISSARASGLMSACLSNTIWSLFPAVDESTSCKIAFACTGQRGTSQRKLGILCTASVMRSIRLLLPEPQLPSCMQTHVPMLSHAMLSVYT